MAQSKRYYWIHVQEEFFQTRITARIQRERNAGNAMYLYIRLLTRAVKFEGILLDEYGEPFDRKDVYLLASLDEEDGTRAVETIERAGGIVETEEGFLYMPEWESFVQSMDESTPRQRKRRAKQRAEAKKNPAPEEATHNDQPKPEPAQEPEPARDLNDTQGATDAAGELEEEPKTPEEVTTQEPEPAKILDLTGKPHEEPEKPADIVTRVIDYLNDKTGRSFKASTKATQGHIKNRLREGFEEADFYKVIDNRVTEWTNEPKMAQYLRPETLFGPKFEGYLQAARESNAGMWEERTGEKVDWEAFDAFMNGGTNA